MRVAVAQGEVERGQAQEAFRIGATVAQDPGDGRERRQHLASLKLAVEVGGVEPQRLSAVLLVQPTDSAVLADGPVIAGDDQRTDTVEVGDPGVDSAHADRPGQFDRSCLGVDDVAQCRIHRLAELDDVGRRRTIQAAEPPLAVPAQHDLGLHSGQ